MDCEQSHFLISRLIDREIDPAEREHLESHMQECTSCQTTLDAFRQQDAELRAVFARDPAQVAVVAERVMAQLQREPQLLRRRFRWLPIVASLSSAAAGFLAALLIFRPWVEVEPEQLVVVRKIEVPIDRYVPVPWLDPIAAESKPQVELALATGLVEMQGPEDKDRRALQPGDVVGDGTRVRTAPLARCEFRCPDGTEVRMNGGTELYFIAERRLGLQQGQVMLNVAQAEAPFEVETEDAVVAGQATLFDLYRKPKETVLTVVQGQTRVEGRSKKEKKAEEIVKSGEVARIVDGEVAFKDRAYLLVQTTNWVNELLVKKGRDNPELEQHLNSMLAQLGNEKIKYLTEEEIRSLGDHCVMPMTRFVQSADAEKKKDDRRFATRILADLAQPWSVPDLIGLLLDEDDEVRYHAARALKRLTARNGALPPEEWKKLSLAGCKSEYEIWKSWWEDNKYRYPKAP
jgi:ferric-dicitrate binding protein FerR (iron transport regulator)